MIHLRGHRALVTGSTQGVGRAIAEAFAESGADLVIHGRDANDDFAGSVAACRAHGVEVHSITGDLADPTPAAIEQLFDSATSTLPKIDILVNNAGSLFDVPYLEMDRARFERTWRLNVEAGYFLTQRFAQHWIERGVGGRVLFTGSINGRLAEEHSTAYDISKAAIEMMVKTLCVALSPHKIRVNGMGPGLVRTPLTKGLDEKPEFDRWMRLHTPNGQVPLPSVCGPAAVFLVSDAAEHIEGQMLLVDGGMSAWQQPDWQRRVD